MTLNPNGEGDVRGDICPVTAGCGCCDTAGATVAVGGGTPGRSAPGAAAAAPGPAVPAAPRHRHDNDEWMRHFARSSSINLRRRVVLTDDSVCHRLDRRAARSDGTERRASSR